jgi:glycerophosphoryl diester phosphodiesterase
MNKQSFLFIFLVWVAAAKAQPSVRPRHDRVLVTAHRGDWRDEPENSVRAFLAAADLGVDIVELDLNRTKDGEIVIMHDGTIDRTTNGKGKPSDYTLAELKQFRLKDGLGVPTNNVIPTLREVMIALKGREVMVNLDKSYDYYTEAFAVLKETHTLQQAIFKATVAYPELKARYGRLLDSIIYMPVVNLDKPMARETIVEYLANMKSYAFELIFAVDTSSVLADNRFIRDRGAKIWINALWPSLNAGHDDNRAVEEGDTKGSWDWLIAHGAGIIQTDRPRELVRYLGSR